MLAQPHGMGAGPPIVFRRFILLALAASLLRSRAADRPEAAARPAAEVAARAATNTSPLHPVEVRNPPSLPQIDTDLVEARGSPVGAMEPKGAATVYLTGDLPPGDVTEAADKWAKKERDESCLEVTKKKRVRLGEIAGVCYGFKSRGVSAKITFFPFAEGTWRIVGVSAAAAGKRYLPQILLSMQSFGPLSPEYRARIETRRLRVVMARAGEDIMSLSNRNESVLDPAATALRSGLLGNEIFKGGELAKVVCRERFEERSP